MHEARKGIRGVKMKKTIDMTNALLMGNCLLGTVFEHPVLGSFPMGTEVRTSSILNRNGNTVETRNTIYNVINWVSEPAEQKQSEQLNDLSKT